MINIEWIQIKMWYQIVIYKKQVEEQKKILSYLVEIKKVKKYKQKCHSILKLLFFIFIFIFIYLFSLIWFLFFFSFLFVYFLDYKEACDYYNTTSKDIHIQMANVISCIDIDKDFLREKEQIFIPLESYLYTLVSYLSPM